MTDSPRTIDRLATLTEAERVMREQGIRHLPVVDAGTLCGILSQRDLLLLANNLGMDPDTTLVHAAMTDHPFVVTSDTPVDEVVEIMAEHKYGSVVVMGRDGVDGIFTAVDACRALVDVLARATS
ncbi:MAG: CBS domain-containing protein [Proteobacteria bacterium]|nr:CBS domain-containing protein [Pseudomonadota bacterium]